METWGDVFHEDAALLRQQLPSRTSCRVVARSPSQTRSNTRSGMGPTDAALVVAARAGEAWAQEALFARHGKMVLGLAHRVLAGREDADDLTQDVFMHALSRLETLDNPQAFAAWIGSITVRMASKRLRRNRLMVRLGLRRNEPIDLDAIISKTAPTDVQSELRLVYGMLQRLPAEERVAFLLRRVDGLELTEISDRMGLSLATVKRRLVSAEARLERAKARL